MEYNFKAIEASAKAYWKELDIYKVKEDPSKPHYYVLDMFPYPSGAGLHVGHPLGYIATDIVARYKRHKGFCVLHPMGFDAFGLPAEQYAIQTGQDPRVTTDINAKRYRDQLENLGFCYDWSRSFKTSDPDYFKWTQWAFIKMYHSYYDTAVDKALPITLLVEHFKQKGTNDLTAFGSTTLTFSAEEWKAMEEKEQQEVLMNYRLAYLGETLVNWCSELGTVLANDEVSEGLSVRGGHPVEQRLMKQWCLRITAYAERLLKGLDSLDWSQSLKEMQRNWIGKSEGAEVLFDVKDSSLQFTVFTTRPDTLFGVTFMVLAPESDLVDKLTTPTQAEEVKNYVAKAKQKNERERMADKKVSGVFTGSYALHPISNEPIPIWVSEYVLAGYGTGAIMAVPAHDTRDFAFAKHFALPIKQVVLPFGEEVSDPSSWESAKSSEQGNLVQSDFLNGHEVASAKQEMIKFLESHKRGSRKINYRLRDAIFSRQRYWGEPFPIYYKDGIPYTLDEAQLPLQLPKVDKYMPTETGEPPLGRAKEWKTSEGYPLELSTMPGFAGSAAYYLRYMDPSNPETLVSKDKNSYWKQVDLYLGGTEHATGHLIYSRYWNKFLYDLGLICQDEPFQKLINQGMILGKSQFVHRIKGTQTFVTQSKLEQYDTMPIHVDISLVMDNKLNIEEFRKWREEYAKADFILEDDGSYLCTSAVEKMSKSFYNVVNPDDVIAHYGADTLRMYEMFLGPLEQSKPWDTQGIDGVHRFLKRLIALFYDNDTFAVCEDAPSPEELKTLHKLIQKIENDIEQFSFNTSISAFMIALTDLQQQACTKRTILEPFVVLLSPFAPHLAEFLYRELGHTSSVVDAPWPIFKPEYIVESTKKYPVSFNGKVRFTLELPLDATKEEIEKGVLLTEEAKKWMEGKTPKKVIVVPGRIINIVL